MATRVFAGVLPHAVALIRQLIRAGLMFADVVTQTVQRFVTVSAAWIRGVVGREMSRHAVMTAIRSHDARKPFEWRSGKQDGTLGKPVSPSKLLVSVAAPTTDGKKYSSIVVVEATTDLGKLVREVLKRVQDEMRAKGYDPLAFSGQLRELMKKLKIEYIDPL